MRCINWWNRGNVDREREVVGGGRGRVKEGKVMIWMLVKGVLMILKIIG